MGRKNSNCEGGGGLGMFAGGRGTMSILFGWNKGVMWDKDGSRGGILGL